MVRIKWGGNRTMNKAIVTSRFAFPGEVEKIGGLANQDWAFISITSTPECAKYYLTKVYDEDPTEDNSHYLPEGPRVCNVEFDDLNQDIEWEGHLFKTITEEQADKIVEFIESNLGRNFLIHCRAGASRSQGVWRFIMDMYPENYKECTDNLSNPCLSPNIEVVAKLKRAYYKKHQLYEYSPEHPYSDSNRIIITKEAIRDAGKYVMMGYWGDNTPPEDEVPLKNIGFLVGAIDCTEDYYWVYLDYEFNIQYHSCVGGYEVFRKKPRQVTKNLVWPRRDFMSILSEEELEKLKKKTYDAIINMIYQSALFEAEKYGLGTENYLEKPELGILHFSF